MADEQAAAAWNAAAEDLERAELAVPRPLAQRRPAFRGPTVIRTAIAAFLVIVVSILLGRPTDATRS